MSKFKKIWLPVIVVIVCIGIIVAVLAVVLSDKSGSGHIVIDKDDGGMQVVKGELDISLKRQRLEMLTLDVNALPLLKVDGDVKDFSKSDDNIFGIDCETGVAPGCYFAADMQISNTKPYPFEYRLEIIPVNGEVLLADQLELTVTVDGETFIKRTLGSGLTTKVFPTVQAGEVAKFTAKLEYLDTANNNDTKNATLTFDMIVHAKLI